jgi:hypothetical protein
MNPQMLSAFGQSVQRHSRTPAIEVAIKIWDGWYSDYIRLHCLVPEQSFKCPRLEQQNDLRCRHKTNLPGTIQAEDMIGRAESSRAVIATTV